MWRSQTRVKAEKHKKYKGIQQQRDLNKEPKKNGKQGSNKKNCKLCELYAQLCVNGVKKMKN